jgi:hypothetical protein
MIDVFPVRMNTSHTLKVIKIFQLTQVKGKTTFLPMHGLTLDYDINDVDDDDRWSAYSVDKADPVCRKFDDLIRRGLISRNGILYKYL